ncbi:MAG TPA: ABC transporter permease [Magnetospirillaceae bacterium]|jgi:osmoprotectant transport system permease protein
MTTNGRHISWYADPALGAALLTLALVFGMPLLRPVFAGAFPELDRPIYVGDPFWLLLLSHLGLVAASSVAAGVVGIGAGILVTRKAGRSFRGTIETLAAMGQTFPPVAVLAVAVPLIGFGAWPAFIALALYGLLPIIENTVSGLEQVPAAVREAAASSGMTATQVLRDVELPIAAPIILTGVRISVTINIGTAALASTVGAKSLGLPLIVGLNSDNIAYVIQGALLVGALAITVDLAFGRALRYVQRWKVA